MSISDKTKNKIKKNLENKIKAKGRSLLCPICGNNGFILADGFGNETLQDSVATGLIIGGPAIPTVIVICNNCGHMMKFSAGVLELIPKEKEE